MELGNCPKFTAFALDVAAATLNCCVVDPASGAAFSIAADPLTTRQTLPSQASVTKSPAAGSGIVEEVAPAAKLTVLPFGRIVVPVALDRIVTRNAVAGAEGSVIGYAPASISAPLSVTEMV